MIASIYHCHKHLKAARSLKICKLCCTYPYPIFTPCRHSLTYTVVMFWKIQLKSNFYGSELNIQIVNCLYMYKGIQLKPKFQHTETWSSAAQLPCQLCYRLAVFFCHLLIMLSCSEGKIWRFKDVIFVF